MLGIFHKKELLGFSTHQGIPHSSQALMILTTAARISFPTPATLQSASIRPGSPNGCASLRSRRGILLPIGARRAEEKLLHGTANIMPINRPDFAIHIMSATALRSRISYPYEKSSRSVLGPPRWEASLPTRPTPPKRSKKRSPRLQWADAGAQCFPRRIPAGTSRKVGGSGPSSSPRLKAKPRSLSFARTSPQSWGLPTGLGAESPEEITAGLTCPTTARCAGGCTARTPTR